jgi:hypothetical protein
MFAVARSIFWLGLAFMVIKPEAQLPDAGAVSAQVLSAGTQMVAQHVAAAQCDELACAAGQALITAVIETSLPAIDPMHEETATGPVPFPKPRPDWLESGRPQRGA